MIFDSFGEYVFLDGAMGTMLQKYGLKVGDKPDLMNITSPDVVEKIHRMYVEAGCDIINTNTFGSNALLLEDTGYSVEKVITTAVGIAKRATAGTNVKVALNIGPTGQLLDPLGDLEPEEAFEIFKEMAIAGERAGADLVAVETMSDLEEIEAAIFAALDNTKLPVFATMSFGETGRTFMGCSVEDFVEMVEESDPTAVATAIGLNCSLGPAEMFETVERFAKATKLPLIVKPNAGLPDKVDGSYHLGAKAFAEQMMRLKEFGVKIVGGCCGTTPEYISELVKVFS